MKRRNLCSLIVFVIFLVFELTAARTVTHYEIITKPNGDRIRRTWTTDESDEVESVPVNNKRFRPLNLEPLENDKDFTEMIKDAARRKGMDPESVAELLRTKAPVVKVTIDPKTGHKHTTTYKLEPSDGSGAISIKSNTVVEVPAVVTRSQEHPYAVSGMIPMTRTYLNRDGQPVRETYSIPHRIRPSEVEEWPMPIRPWQPQTIPLNAKMPRDGHFITNPDAWRVPLHRSYPGFSLKPQASPGLSEEDFWHQFEPITNPEDQGESPTEMEPNNADADDDDDDGDEKAKTPRFPNKPLTELVKDLYKTTTTTTTTTVKPKTTTTTRKPTTTTTKKPSPAVRKTTTTTKKPATTTTTTTKKPTTTTTTTTKKPTTTTTTKPSTTTKNPSETQSKRPQETSSTPQKSTEKEKCLTKDENADDDRNVIVKYLSKVDLTIDDVVSKKHQTLTKTIIDDDGNILTATFMISSVKGQKPIK